MSRTYYIRDRRSGAIVNAVAAHGTKAEVASKVLPGRADRGHLYLDDDPPTAELQKYRYSSERP